MGDTNENDNRAEKRMINFGVINSIYPYNQRPCGLSRRLVARVGTSQSETTDPNPANSHRISLTFGAYWV